MSWKTELDKKWEYILKNGDTKDLNNANKIILDASDNLNPMIETIKENNTFWSMELDKRNIDDLQKGIDNDGLEGLVDETQGGIIAYINRSHVERIIKILNGEQNE